jgi:hypothetical protein
MNPAVIILGVLLIVVLFYMIYSSYFSTASKLSGELYLMTNPAEINVDKLSKPDATRYSYGIWLFVNTWSAPASGAVRTIFYRQNDVHLYLEANGSLKLATKPNASRTVDTATGLDVLVTNNFPIQKWVYVVMSIDNTILDVYLDGKLVKSVVVPQVGPDVTNSVKFNSLPANTPGWDAYISNFERITTPLDPRTVWDMYMRGSGSNLSVSKMVGNYNLNLTLLKNGELSQKFKLF